MHIVVFTRATPDTAARVDVGPNGALNWGDAALVVNPWDEYALEEAIVRTENGGRATAVALGSAMHGDALKQALAMGVADAVRIEDPALDSADSLAYAVTAAAAVRKLGDVGLVIFGKEATDVGSDAHIYQTARKLGWTMLSYVSRILAIDEATGSIRVERLLEQGKQTVTARLPAVISVMKDINEPRYPSFIGIRKASKAVIPVWSLSDLDAELTPARTHVVAYRALPTRDTQVEMIDGTPEQQAATLVDRLLEEKVL